LLTHNWRVIVSTISTHWVFEANRVTVQSNQLLHTNCRNLTGRPAGCSSTVAAGHKILHVINRLFVQERASLTSEYEHLIEEAQFCVREPFTTRMGRKQRENKVTCRLLYGKAKLKIRNAFPFDMSKLVAIWMPFCQTGLYERAIAVVNFMFLEG